MGIPRRQKRIEGRHGFVDGIRYVMPIDSWESSALIAAFPIDWDKARARIPPGDVHPFRMWKRGLMIVTVIDYRKTDIGAYIEYSLAIACTNGARPAPRLLPGLFQRLFGTGQYVFDLPVSTEVSVFVSVSVSISTSWPAGAGSPRNMISTARWCRASTCAGRNALGCRSTWVPRTTACSAA